jgi:DNA polymerase-3 subunit gamma/tau
MQSGAMGYLVLARKYRPQTFDDVVEQGHVTRTLMNAIQHGRVAHAILFSGPRGTGKTTIARILAKAVNCQAGPTPHPCNTCRSCTEITAGNAADVFEIDGASNNSVDQIRELRENVKYMPAYSPYKIYIIDEVHMLSTPAFNALLKTLEEPPAHIMFMFATTEPHKIPVTILSRCQRYDLRRIGSESLIGYMAKLCAHEDIAVPEESLVLMAREAGGSMRDALSLLDQVMTCSDGPIAHEQVLNILGVVDRHLITELAAALLAGDVARLLLTIQTVYERGQDLKKLYTSLLTHFRNLIVIKVGDPGAPLVDLPEGEIQLLREQVGAFSAGALNQIFNLLYREEVLVRLAAQPRLAVEMVLIQICQIKPALPMDELINSVEALRQVVLSDGGKMMTAVTAAAADPPGNPAAKPVSNEDSPSSPKPTPRGAMAIPSDDHQRETAWRQIVEMLGASLPALAANLQQSALVAINERCLEIEINGNDFSINRVKRRESIQAIQNAVQELFNRSFEIVVHGKSADPAVKRKKKVHEDQLKQQALSHPMVSEVIELFQGKVVDVKILSPTAKKDPP